MWKLVKEDGSVFRDGFPTQWEALISAKKADGTRYKKKEALQVQSGTRVYKEKYINTSILGQNVYEDGKYGPTYVQKKQVAVKLPYLLVDVYKRQVSVLGKYITVLKIFRG